MFSRLGPFIGRRHEELLAELHAGPGAAVEGESVGIGRKRCGAGGAVLHRDQPRRVGHAGADTGGRAGDGVAGRQRQVGTRAPWASRLRASGGGGGKGRPTGTSAAPSLACGSSARRWNSLNSAIRLRRLRQVLALLELRRRASR